MSGIKAGDKAADRYVELCEMAMCSPDSPGFLPLGDRWLWLQTRLREHGHHVTITEIGSSMRAWRARRDATPSVHVATITDVPETKPATEEG